MEGVEEESRERLREEVRALRRHPLTAPGDREDVLDARRAEQERDVRLAAVDGADGRLDFRRVRDPLEAVAIDDSTSSSPSALDELRAPSAIRDGRRAVGGRAASAASASSGLSTPLAVAGSRGPDGRRTRGGSGGRGAPDPPAETTSAMMRALAAQLAAELDRALVPVVAVGDEEARLEDVGSKSSSRQSREPSASRSGSRAGGSTASSPSRSRKNGSGCARVARSSSRRSSRTARCVRS